MKITISGSLGSGKSSVAKALSKKLNYEHYSIGDFQRMMAHEKGLSILELAQLAIDNPNIDHLTDDKLKEIGKTQNNFVIDARLGWYFIPDSIKIFLYVNDEESTKRIFSVKRFNDPVNTSLETTKENINKRKQSEIQRYSRLYKIDYYDPKHYDLLIDTSDISIEDVVAKIQSYLDILK